MPSPFDPDNPQPPGRFQIKSRIDIVAYSDLVIHDAVCSDHGRIFKFVLSSYMFRLTNRLEKLRIALYQDHIKRFHDAKNSQT